MLWRTMNLSDELEGEIHSSPLCPYKAFLTDGLLIRWNKNGDFSGNGKLSRIRMGMAMGMGVE